MSQNDQILILAVAIGIFFIGMGVLSVVREKYFDGMQYFIHFILVFLFIQNPKYFPFVALFSFVFQLFIFYSLDLIRQTENVHVFKLMLTLFYFLSSVDIRRTKYSNFIQFSLLGLFLGILTDFSIFTFFVFTFKFLRLVVNTMIGKKLRLLYYYSYKFEHNYLRELFNNIVYGGSAWFLILLGIQKHFQDQASFTVIQIYFVLIDFLLIAMLTFFFYVSFKKNLIPK